MFIQPYAICLVQRMRVQYHRYKIHSHATYIGNQIQFKIIHFSGHFIVQGRTMHIASYGGTVYISSCSGVQCMFHYTGARTLHRTWRCGVYIIVHGSTMYISLFRDGTLYISSFKGGTVYISSFMGILERHSIYIIIQGRHSVHTVVQGRYSVYIIVHGRSFGATQCIYRRSGAIQYIYISTFKGGDVSI